MGCLLFSINACSADSSSKPFVPPHPHPLPLHPSMWGRESSLRTDSLWYPKPEAPAAKIVGTDTACEGQVADSCFPTIHGEKWKALAEDAQYPFSHLAPVAAWVTSVWGKRGGVLGVGGVGGGGVGVQLDCSYWGIPIIQTQRGREVCVWGGVWRDIFLFFLEALVTWPLCHEDAVRHMRTVNKTMACCPFQSEVGASPGQMKENMYVMRFRLLFFKLGGRASPGNSVRDVLTDKSRILVWKEVWSRRSFQWRFRNFEKTWYEDFNHLVRSFLYTLVINIRRINDLVRSGSCREN